MNTKLLQLRKMTLLRITISLGFLIMFSFTLLFAQEIPVSGTVMNNENGEPLPGVNVIISGTQTGSVTDFEGKYKLTVPGRKTTLIFSYVGFRNTEVEVGNQSVIDVKMEPDIVQLSEVLITSLGIEKEKKEITYAAQNISTEEISEARELNMANSFQGKVAGLDIIRSSAGVGSASRVLLRGNRSIVGNNQPLYIVDGVPLQNFSWGTPNSEQGGVQTSDGIGNLNPDDIATVTVLKGPNATALYGARANNGAIVITTKQGMVRKTIGVEFNTNVSMEKALILTKFQNVYGQGNGGVYIKNSEQSWGSKMEGQMVDHWSPDPNWDGPDQYAFLPHDNFKDFFQTGYNVANTLNLQGGNEQVRGYFSYTNTISQGIIENNKLKRNNFHLRINGNPTEKFSFDAKLTYFDQNVDNRPSTGDDFNNPMRAIYRQPGNISLEQAKDFEYFDEAGIRRQHYWNPNSNGGQNIYWMVNRTEREETRDRILGMASLKYMFTDDLSLLVRSSIDKLYDVWSYKQYYDTYTIAYFGNLQINNSSSMLFNNDFLVNYKKMIGNNFLSMDISFGGNILKQSLELLDTRTNRLLKPNLFVITNTSQILASQGGADYQINSLYGFATFGIKNLLFLDITGRNDWSSTLPKENWSYFYPSYGLTWVVTNMFRSQSSIVPFAKIRANYAEVGNDTDPYIIHKTYFFSAGGQLGYAWRSNLLPAENLKPENTKSVELGFDIKFFANRLGIDFTWYKSNSFNQLLAIPVPVPSGYSYKFINTGNIQNKGVEITLNATPVRVGDFSWDIMFNYAQNESRVIELTEQLDEYIIRGRSWMTTIKVVEGKPFGEIYTYGFIRNEEGRVLIDNLGLPVISSGHTMPMGNANPDWIGGLSNMFKYKGINLSILLDMRMGGDIFSYTDAILADDGMADFTLDGRNGFVVDGVRPVFDAEGNVTDYEENDIVTTAEAYWTKLGGRSLPIGEAFRYDASYIRIREILLSYTWNLKSSALQSIGLSFYGRNLGFLYNASGVIDPNMSVGVSNIQGISALAVPSTRSYGINLNFKF